MTSKSPNLDRLTNPSYYSNYKVLKQFVACTDIGGVLNTSFTLHGESVVSSSDDALSTFGRSGLPDVALGNSLLKKPCGTALDSTRSEHASSCLVEVRDRAGEN